MWKVAEGYTWSAFVNLLCDIWKKLCELIATVKGVPQLEGLPTVPICNADGDTTWYIWFILDEDTWLAKKIYFDAQFNQIDTMPEWEPCDSAKELLDKFCTLMEECCDVDDPQNRDRWCQAWFTGWWGVANSESTIEFNTWNWWVTLPNPYTEQQLLDAIIADNPWAEFEVIDWMLCRFDGFGGVSIKTTTATDTWEVNWQGNIIYSYAVSITAPLVIFTAWGDPICKDYLRTWGKYEEPIAEILSNLLATNTETLTCINELKNQVNAWESCETPTYTKACPPPVCPPPSEEIFCDPNGTKYVIVTYASEVCGVSGTFEAEWYYATPQVKNAFEPTGIPQICEDSVVKDQECLLDECGKKWSCATIINVVGGLPVESQTCVAYVAPECPVEWEGKTASTSKKILVKKAISASFGAVKSIKLSVATINTVITQTADPETFELPSPIGQTCPCACGGEKQILDKLCEVKDVIQEFLDCDCEGWGNKECSWSFEFCGWDASTNNEEFFDEWSANITVNGTATSTPRDNNIFTTKSQAYQDTIDYVNSLPWFTMTVVQDVPLWANGQSPRFRISYEWPCDWAKITLFNSSVNDVITADFTQTPTVATYQDDNGDEITSTNWIKE